jgi:hypothetical protein
MSKVWVLVLIALGGLIACSSEGTDIDYYSFRVQEVIIQMAEKGDLSARAVVASEVYDSLTEEDYPFSLVLIGKEYFRAGNTSEIEVPEDNTLETYLAGQGLSEDEFLAHPKLRTFVESHLIPVNVDFPTLWSTQQARLMYTTVSGNEVVFTTKDNLAPGNGDTIFANDIPFSHDCFFDPTPAPAPEGGYGRICYADAPLVTNFDWSE